MSPKGKARKIQTRPYVEPDCIECGRRGVLTAGREVHPHRPDLHAKLFFVCPCGARVGCHPGSSRALGKPCGPETALARDKAHRVFDPLWRAKEAAGTRRADAREAAYRWLARELGLRRDDCHISHMDLETCRRVVELCRPLAERLGGNRRHRPVPAGG